MAKVALDGGVANMTLDEVWLMWYKLDGGVANVALDGGVASVALDGGMANV